jgi:hypothetical protein
MAKTLSLVYSGKARMPKTGVTWTSRLGKCRVVWIEMAKKWWTSDAPKGAAGTGVDTDEHFEKLVN